jgi:hypothetical protein
VTNLLPKKNVFFYFSGRQGRASLAAAASGAGGGGGYGGGFERDHEKDAREDALERERQKAQKKMDEEKRRLEAAAAEEVKKAGGRLKELQNEKLKMETEIKHMDNEVKSNYDLVNNTSALYSHLDEATRR